MSHPAVSDALHYVLSVALHSKEFWVTISGGFGGIRSTRGPARLDTDGRIEAVTRLE